MASAVAINLVPLISLSFWWLERGHEISHFKLTGETCGLVENSQKDLLKGKLISLTPKNLLC